MNKERILIVGASSAIGSEAIRALSTEKTMIFAHYCSGLEKLTKLQDEISGQIFPINADLSTQEGCEKLIQSVSANCDFPDKILLLAAPRVALKRFKDLSCTEFMYTLNVQLISTFHILRAFLPKMAIAKSGKIIFMLSQYTLGVPPAAMAHYITAKYSLLGFMKALSSEYAAKKICINAISPSMLETAFLEEIPTMVVEQNAAMNPHKRNGTPLDVVPLIKFLFSDDSLFITGANIPVTGGA